MNYLVMEGAMSPEKDDEYVRVKKSELSSLKEEASLWRSCYQDRCNNKYVEYTIVKAIVEELERIKLSIEGDVEALTEKVAIYKRQGIRDRMEYAAKLEQECDRLRERMAKLST